MVAIHHSFFHSFIDYFLGGRGTKKAMFRAANQDFFKKMVLEDVEKSHWSQESNFSSADLGAPVLRDIVRGSSFAICSGVQSHHQGWHVDASLSQNSAYEIVTMRCSIWRRSEVSIVVSFGTPTAEHFFLLALYLRIRVASACSVTLDRICIASIRFSAESGVEQTPSAPIGWPSMVQMDAMDA